MKSLNKPVPVTDPQRLEASKELVVSFRKEKADRSSYELWGILYSRGAQKLKAVCIDDAPTSGDFAPMVTKARLAQCLDHFDLIVEFRGAWKSDAEAKLKVWETEAAAR